MSLVAATSGLLFGFDIAVINGAILLLKEQFALSEVQTEIRGFEPAGRLRGRRGGRRLVERSVGTTKAC